MTPEPSSTFTPVEWAALGVIREDRPEVLAALPEWLAPVLEDLSQSCQGLLATELEADDFLDRFRSEFAGRMMADMEPWGEDEDLREAAVGLLVRYLVAEARGGFVRRVVGAKWN